MEFFSSFHDTLPADSSIPKNVKRIGIDIEYFSSVCGRTLLVGNVTYMSDKNFKSKQCFEDYFARSEVCIPAVFVLNEENHALARVKTYDNFFIQRRRDILRDIDDKFRLYGMMQEVPSRKRSSARTFGSNAARKKKYFKFKTKERFTITVSRVMAANGRENAAWITKVCLHCRYIGSPAAKAAQS